MPDDRPDDLPGDAARRLFLKRALGAAGLGGLLAGGCNISEEPTRPDGSTQTPTGHTPPRGLSASGCEPSEEHLSQQSLDVRQALDYTPETPVPEERCDNCRFYLPSESGPEGKSVPEGACGGCEHFAGPVAAGGWCTVWDVRGA